MGSIARCMSGGFLQGTKTRSVEDRGRRIAFWIALVGWAQTNTIYGLYAYHNEFTWLHLVRYLFYTVTLGGIAVSAHKNWNFKLIRALGFGALYFHMWGVAFYDAWQGNGSLMSFPPLLFTPIFLVLILGYRALLFFAAAQAAMVYIYARVYVADIYGFDKSVVNTAELGAIFGLASGVSLIILAIVSYAREKTDKRLLKLIQETERLAAEDPLTGLSNRRSFIQRVNGLWNDRVPFTVAFFDLNKFKPLNDEYGHAIGDAVLKAIGQRLQRNPNVIEAARFGGDEFAAIIEEDLQSHDLDERIRCLHAEITAPIEVEFGQVSVGAAMGFARAMIDAKNVSNLLHAADTAMMRCKSSGETIAKFDRAHDQIGLSTNVICEKFRKAIDEGEIKPALQPVVDATTTRVVGYELLARWPDSGLPRDPGPLEFIPIAEKLGLLNQLLWSTMDQALAYLQGSNGFLAINVSPSQLSNSKFLIDLFNIVDAHAFSTSQVELEITEHVAFRNLEENIVVLTKARELGFQIVLDDFGSGYASLSLLERLPLTKIKLDKSLMGNLKEGGVLKAAIDLASTLGFQSCIEGIETEREARFATKQGCDQMQGYWFGHPEIIQLKDPSLRVAS
ncbi:MAG: bifunctional diguanylate cyclase/phosphodiesterase [Hyphomonadaceae bacterium]|nr:bifunctional diguanylate cyclase/phosphodiesterase [Hyphomonadaceae bacterium]